VQAFLAESAEQIVKNAAPAAAKTMSELLHHKSGFVRFQAAQDLLNRNKVGDAAKAAAPGGFVFRIDLGVKETVVQGAVVDVTPTPVPQENKG
jgi:hypothetical protein